MGGIQSNATLQQIAERLKAANSVVLSTHAKPDGDAFGGTLGMARVVERLGHHAEIWHMPPTPASYRPLLGNNRINLVGNDGMPDDNADLIVIVDTCAWSQLENLRPYLETKRDRVCVLDHHIQGDNIADLCYADASAGSVCEIITEFIPMLGLKLDVELATPLYLGIATDTGWFRFSNTTARTMRHAACLLEAGVDHNGLMQMSEQRDRPSRLRLLAGALSSLELFQNNSIAVLSLRHSDYEQCGAAGEDHHGFADLPLCVESIQMVCVITEAQRGIIKLSLRSKAGPDAINVSEFAAPFGGGGHARASGAKITNSSFEDVHARIIEAVRNLSS